MVITEFALAADSQPEGITAGPDGRIWFTETEFSPIGAGAIGRINTDGTGYTRFPLPGFANHPHGVAAYNGALWFTEKNNGANEIGQITTSGSIVLEDPVPTHAAGPDIIASGPGGLWFSEVNAEKIGFYHPGRANGQTGTNFTEFPLPAGALPHGLVYHGGHVWYTDRGRNVIGRLTPSGGAVTEYGLPTSQSWPQVIAVGPDGNLWFSQNLANRIGRLNPSTGQVTEFVMPSSNSAPWGVTAGPDGNVWYTARGINKIGAISTSGVFLGEFSIPTASSGPYEITTGPDGNLWFVEGTADKIARAVITP